MSQPVALITGTSTGIGLSTAIYFARAGYTTIATMRDPTKADALRARASKGGVSVNFAKLDVQDDSSVEICVADVLKQHGRIDVLVNNAGAGMLGSTEQTPLAAAQRTLDINFFGVWRCTQAVLPAMRAAKAGR